MSSRKADPTTPMPDIVGIASRVESPYQSGPHALTLEDLRDVERLGQRVSYMRYYPRLQYDIRMKEWSKGIPNLLKLATDKKTSTEQDIEDREVRQSVARVWCPTAPDQVVITLSIRTMMDCLLRTLALPEGSEVVFSGISIPHMVDIVQHHKLVPVAFDIDLLHFSPDVDQCRRVVKKGVTKLMIIAPLFGRPMKRVNELLAIAKENNILTILDGAQSFSISDIINTYDADIRTVSFGSIKYSTAFGGAVTYFKCRDLASRVAATEAACPAEPSAPTSPR
jgi:DNA-binding transcriptional MocR family regulator